MNLQDAFIFNGAIGQNHVDFYFNYGYLIAESLLSGDEIAELKKETANIFRGKCGYIDGMVEVADNEADDDVLKKYIAIHFPHKISKVIYNYLFHKKVINILTQIVSSNLKCMQSMLFVKAPDKAGQSWHQDEYFIPTRDKSLTGAWIAIDDANISNGCLWIIPGSNKAGYMMPRIANHDKNFADIDTVDVSQYPEESIIPVEVKKGSVVFFNGYTLHSSLQNTTTDNFRTALVNHYMSAESMLPWDQDGKFTLTEDLRDIVLVAGNDPYAYKGIVDINKPYLRPEVLKIKTGL